ncbi:MAG: PAS domain S-box protein, partial [Anaerovoracaceae bacterium]
MNSSDRRTKLKTEDYKAVLDNIDDGIFVVDTKGIILEVNKAVEKNGGKKMDELIGRNIDDLVKEGYCSEFVSSRVLMSGREEVLVQKTGDNRELLVT